MTTLEIKKAIAAYHKKTVADLTVDGQDLGLLAMNQARMQAELLHDFNFQRKLLTLSVDTVTGGSLEAAVIMDTTTNVTIKTLLDVGQFDDNGNFRPVEWTTVEEGLDRVRAEQPWGQVRYPTDAQFESWPSGQRRFTVANQKIYSWPRSTSPGTALSIGLEAYVFSGDWVSLNRATVANATTGGVGANGTYTETGSHNGFPYYSQDGGLFVIYYDGLAWIITNDLTSTTNSYFVTQSGASPNGTYAGQGTYGGTPTVVLSDSGNTPLNSDIWTTVGAQYILWSSIIHLNHYFKTFVSRTEGNLAPPQQMADAALQTMVEWDIFKYEQFRRHGR